MAHQPNSVRVLEVCKVAPHPPTSLDSATPPPYSLPLTLFDLIWLRFPPVERLFFYEISTPSIDDTNFFHSILIPKLKTSLSIALQHFLPLAGNITWPQESPKPILTYTQGNTVSLTVAESDSQADHFNHLSSIINFVEAREYHPLIPELPVSHEKASAMAFQVTIFPKRGFAIGTSMHHATLDGKTSTMFVKSWAHICKLVDHENCHNNILLPVHLKPFFDRTVIKDPAGMEPIFLNQLTTIGNPNNKSLILKFRAPPVQDPIRGTFVLTRAKIQTLRQLLKEKHEQRCYDDQSVNVHRQHLSTFCVTCAYIWVCWVKTQDIEGDKEVGLGFTVDCRCRLDPPTPENYLGNCVSGRSAAVEAKMLVGEDGLCVAVDAISVAIKGLENEGLLKGAETWIPVMYGDPEKRGDKKYLTLAGSPRFAIYETDFGWGRPKKVEIVSVERTGAMSLAESMDGGVEVGLVLSEHDMHVFAALFAEGLQELI